jgi:uncharacterized protein Yka (UPF0111/DUF47 family)
MKRIGFPRAMRGPGRGGGESLIASLELQLGETVAACRLACDLADGSVTSADARRRMTEIEHRGDGHRADLVNELVRVPDAPIDREDLFRLSRSIDDVLDNLRDFARALDLYEIRSCDSFRGPLEAIASAIRDLQTAVLTITREPGETAQAALAAKKSTNEIRRHYDDEVGLLFQGPVSMDVLKRRELLRRLDVVGLRLHEAADALSDAVVKRRA